MGKHDYESQKKTLIAGHGEAFQASDMLGYPLYANPFEGLYGFSPGWLK